MTYRFINNSIVTMAKMHILHSYEVQVYGLKMLAVLHIWSYGAATSIGLSQISFYRQDTALEEQGCNLNNGGSSNCSCKL